MSPTSEKTGPECQRDLRPVHPGQEIIQPELWLCFGIHGILVGTLISRLPEAQHDLGLNEVGFSIILKVVTFGFFINTPLSDRLLKSFGVKQTLVLFFLVTTLAQTVLVLVTNLYALVF